MMIKTLKYALVALLVALLVGCPMPGAVRTPPVTTPLGAAAVVIEARPLVGRVSFGQGWQAQTTMGEVGNAASVALINTATNQTVSTALSDNTGAFILSFPRSFVPDPTAVYHLEAIKGLGGNVPGHNAARVRTLVRWLAGGWLSAGNAAPGTVVVNQTTTALAIAAALINGDGVDAPLDFASLIGTVAIGESSDTYTPPGGGGTVVSQSDLTAVIALVKDNLAADQDPVAAIGLHAVNNGGITRTWHRVNSGLAITGVSQATGSIGASLTITGTGFSPTPGNDVLTFNGVTATTTAATTTSLATTVPAGATSGPITLTVGGLTVLGPTFGVAVDVSAVSPGTGTAGTSLTLTGLGFSATAAQNLVTFGGGVTAPVSSATPTSLSVTVPVGAISGPVSVAVLGQAGQIPSFTVPVTVSSLSPRSGYAGTWVRVSGTGFSLDNATNVVRFGGVVAKVAGSTPTGLNALVPEGALTGPVTVSVAGQTGTSAENFGISTLSPAAIASLVAGGWTPAVNTPATAYSLPLDQWANGLVTDASGNVYCIAGKQIFKVSTAGHLTVIAGTGYPGPRGDGGPATQAVLSNPSNLMIDPSGNLYFRDATGTDSALRKIDAGSGIVSTVLGGGGTPLVNGGSPTGTKLNFARALLLDGHGNLYFYEILTHALWMVPAQGGTHFGISMAAGLAYRLAAYNYFEQPVDDFPLLDPSTTLSEAVGLAVTPGGDLILGGTGASGRIHVVAHDDGALFGRSMVAGRVYSIAGNGTGGFSGDGGPATLAQFGIQTLSYGAFSPVLDASGNLIFADSGNSRVRVVAASTGTCYGVSVIAGNMYTIAGGGAASTRTPSGFSDDNGPAAAAKLNGPTCLSIDPSGYLYVYDSYHNRIRRIAPNGTITTVAGNGYLSYSGDGGPARHAKLNRPTFMAFDGQGALYVADSGNYAVRRIANGVISTVAGCGTNASTPTGDGGPATEATFNAPTGVAIDAEGNLYISDAGANAIRVVSDGIIQTYLNTSSYASLNQPRGLALDSQGNLYVANTGRSTVLRIEKGSKAVTVVAGTDGAPGYYGDDGPATSAGLNQPQGLAFDASGHLLIADTGNHVVRRIQNGTITTLAGGGANYVGVAGSLVKLVSPVAIAVDAGRTLFISEGNHMVLGLPENGDAFGLLGSFNAAQSIPGLAAGTQGINGPVGIVLDGQGALYAADSNNNCILLVPD